MKRSTSIGAMFLVFVVVAGVLSAVETDDKIKVMFLRGGGTHDWQNNTPILNDVLDQTNDFEVTFTEELDDLAERIRQFDIIVQYTTGMELNSRQEIGLCDFIRNGGGYVGIHSATDSFKNSDRFWEMVGGRFAGHGGGTFTVHIYDRDHPITKGLKDFEIQDETYSHSYHRNAQMRSLTRMNRGNERQSMAWVSSYGKGRVFYTGNGHGREAWVDPHFQRLVVRGAYWAAGRKVKDPPVAKTQETADSAGLYTLFSENVFSFEVPNTWDRMRGAELEQFRRQFEQQAKQLAQQYQYTRPEDFKGTLYIAGFFSPRKQATLVAVVIQIPPQASDYLEQIYEQSKAKVQWGIEQGMIRKAFSNRKVQINRVPALEVDMETADGSRMISYTLYSKDHPDQGVSFTMLCQPGLYSQYESAFKHITSTLRISFQGGQEPESVDETDARAVENKIIEIISEQMGVDKSEITRQTSFADDLKADSLDTVELVMEFEDQFDVSIPDEEAEKIQTVGAAIDYIVGAIRSGNRR